MPLQFEELSLELRVPADFDSKVELAMAKVADEYTSNPETTIQQALEKIVRKYVKLYERNVKAHPLKTLEKPLLSIDEWIAVIEACNFAMYLADHVCIDPASTCRSWNVRHLQTCLDKIKNSFGTN